MKSEEAQIVALKALAFLAEERDRLWRFLDWTGLDLDDVRNGADNPGLHGGILDYFLAHEGLLLEFVEEADLTPDAPAAARRCLPGASTPL